MFMNDNVEYGFVGKNNKVYTHDDKDWDADFDREYFLQSPEELLERRHGQCWDTTELERRWFTEHDFKPKTYFMMYAKEGGTKLPTHTFVVYEKDDKWYWFEQAFADQRGIHEYTSREELIDDVKKKHHDYAAQHRGATDNDFERLRVTGYEKPVYGSNPNEFVANIIQKNPALLNE